MPVLAPLTALAVIAAVACVALQALRAISSDGTALLLVRGGFESYADGSTIKTVPFGAGSPVHNLAHGAFPDWNL